MANQYVNLPSPEPDMQFSLRPALQSLRVPQDGPDHGKEKEFNPFFARNSRPQLGPVMESGLAPAVFRGTKRIFLSFFPINGLSLRRIKSLPSSTTLRFWNQRAPH